MGIRTAPIFRRPLFAADSEADGKPFIAARLARNTGLTIQLMEFASRKLGD
jgi:hypothetical protein